MSSVARIQNALEKKFAQHRVVFWYDDELVGWQEEYAAIQMPGVTKLEVKNNEFGVKHRIACAEPQTKFLLYFQGQRKPMDPENWLLDQLLANGGDPFFPDRATLAQIEAGLPPEFRNIAQQHLQFFRSSDRTNRLRALLRNDDTERSVRLKMLAVICRTEPIFEAILLAMFSEMARNVDDRWVEMQKFELVPFFWQEVGSYIGYFSATPSLMDFSLVLFRNTLPVGGGAVQLDQRQVAIFLSRWKDSQAFRDDFVALSERSSNLLNVKQTLNASEDFKPWLDCDSFRLIDQKLISSLKEGLIGRHMTAGDVYRLSEKRAGMFWGRQDSTVASLYGALSTAAQLIEAMARAEISMESAENGFTKYTESWWRVDQLYRQFLHHCSDAKQPAILENLLAWVEGSYLNQFVAPLAIKWQEWVDRMDKWEAGAIVPQREFHTRFVESHVRTGRKVLVIISDAFRFEAAKELSVRLQTEERWSASVCGLLGSLPSYTQLGMASLLPHRELSFAESGGTVFADGRPTAGLDNRDKILRTAHGGKAGAMLAKDFFALNSKTEGRELFRENDVIYVYHNAIDKIGDDRDSEHETCDAVEKAIKDLLRLLKKAAAINFSTILVTADHGFLYQEKPLEEPDFLVMEESLPSEDVHRRFVATNVQDAQGMFRTFSHAQLGIAGEGKLSFPKGIQRLRKQGSGSRYVHGGLSLQEVVVPVIEAKKERTNEISRVSVSVVRSSSQITSGQVAVSFVQAEPVAEKCLAVELRAGFFSKTGVLLSELKTLRFDSTESDARQREKVERFLFSKEADAFNNQDVILKLETAIPGTNQFAQYAEFSYRLRRAFESDFDEV